MTNKTVYIKEISVCVFTRFVENTPRIHTYRKKNLEVNQMTIPQENGMDPVLYSRNKMLLIQSDQI